MKIELTNINYNGIKYDVFYDRNKDFYMFKIRKKIIIFYIILLNVSMCCGFICSCFNS